MNVVEDLAQGFRQGMRCLASGVCIVSGVSKQGERSAMTASSVTSVSSEPPSLLVCVNQSARMDFVLSDSESFAINVLSSEQQVISELCATPDKAEERFDQGAWLKDEETGLYYLDDSPAVFICQKQQVIEHGTHSIFIGDISKVLVSESETKALVYSAGAYHYV